jgi:hypothetical protein
MTKYQVRKGPGRPEGTHKTHGGSRTATYRAWASMKQRCHNPASHNFKYYGARGIAVCDAWRNSFAAFLADVGECPPGLWLDRLDNSKGYEPGNCAWRTPKEQANNRRKGGPAPDPLSLRQRALTAGLPYHAVYFRIKRFGWSIERALTEPLH